MYVNVVIAFFLCLIVSACSSPIYRTEFVAISKDNKIPLQQAAEVCTAKAKLAELELGYNQQSKISNNLNCISNSQYSNNFFGGINQNSSTQCREEMPSFSDTYINATRRAEVRSLVMRQCLAEHGYLTRSVCVRNCK